MQTVQQDEEPVMLQMASERVKRAFGERERERRREHCRRECHRIHHHPVRREHCLRSC